MNWQERAACTNVDPAVFFPQGGHGRQADYSRALATCALCPVTAECLAFARRYELGERTVHGVFGGLTPAERIAITA